MILRRDSLMKVFILLLLTAVSLTGSDYITFRSEEGAQCTYRKYHLSVISGVEANMSTEGDYVYSPYIKVFVKDLDKFFPKLVKMNITVHYLIYVEKKGGKYVAVKGQGPFSQKETTSGGFNKSSIAKIAKKDLQPLVDKLLEMRLIPHPKDTPEDQLKPAPRKRIIDKTQQSSSSKKSTGGKSSSGKKEPEERVFLK